MVRSSGSLSPAGRDRAETAERDEGYDESMRERDRHETPPETGELRWVVTELRLMVEE